MLLLISFLGICFLFIAFLTHGVVQSNLLFSYYAGILSFITAHTALFVVLVLVALGIFLFSVRFSKETPFGERFFQTVFQLLAAFFIGSFAGLVVLLGVAFLQLNILAITMDINPSIAGVITDRNTIVQTLKKETSPVDIIATENSQEREVVAVAQNETGTAHIYGMTILPAIPNLLILPIERRLSSMILADNTLIITKINESDMQAVGPTLGYMYIKHYFSDRPIKSTPKISVMNKDQYLKERLATANTKVKQLDDEVNLVEEKISSLSAGISHDQSELDYYEKAATDAASLLDKQYQKCINAGEYQNGKYVHYYSQSYCQTQQENMKSDTDLHDKNIQDWTKLLTYDQSQLDAYKTYVTFFKQQKAVIQVGKANLPDELGVFEGPDSIQLQFQSTNSHAIADFVETLIHEYLHYASFTSGKKLSSTFFEEGLTEYFARQAVQDSLSIDTNLGYPIEVKIIEAMTKRIDESEFEDIYFNKDDTELQKTLDRVYGDGFYSKNINTLQALMYTGDSDEVLKFANTIMNQIGGSPLKESDLDSTASSL